MVQNVENPKRVAQIQIGNKSIERARAIRLENQDESQIYIYSHYIYFIVFLSNMLHILLPI